LVEDNRLNINLATQLFKKWKAVYAIAENGQEALDQLKKFDFDLILLDLHMPGLNGFETFSAIRKSEIKTPVVALTADAFEDTREKVYKMGFYEMLIKPYRAEDLANIILNATQHKA
jgi:CheY-like chemotaxis protein